MNPILLIDDDVELVNLLREYLQGEGFAVDIAFDGASGLKAAMAGSYSLLVLDVMMPGLNGLEVLKCVRATNTVPVLMLTARGDEDDKVTGLELGADDYVSKPCTPRELTARIRAILRRGRAEELNETSDAPLNAGRLSLWSEKRWVELDGKPLELTSTEFSLLEQLMRQAGRPVAKEVLFERCLGRPMLRFDRSIDVHVSALRHKLGALPDGRSCIQSVYRQGYQLIAS